MKTRPVVFGEVLVDCFPDSKSVLGGAPFNVAWHLQAFGASPLMISRVGEDELGMQIIDTMRSWGMGIEGIQVDKNYPTGVVNISLAGTEPSYDIVEHSAYDFIDKGLLPDLDPAAILYHGSLACRNRISRETLGFLKARQQGLCFVDINLRKPHYSPSDLAGLMQGASWLKLNEAEFEEIFPVSPNSPQEVTARMRELDLQNLVITRGEAGAEIQTSKGAKYTVKPPNLKTVMDSVGAGDAFSSVLLLGLINNWPIEESVLRAHDFAAAILAVRGATVNDKNFYRPFINKWRLELD